VNTTDRAPRRNPTRSLARAHDCCGGNGEIRGKPLGFRREFRRLPQFKEKALLFESNDLVSRTCFPPPPSMKPSTNTPIHPDLPTFDPNEQLASVFLSNVTDFETRLNLRAVSTAFLNAEKQDASTPVDVGTTHRFGKICYGAGNLKSAYDWFKKASEQDQGESTFNNRDSMYNLAACLLNRGRRREKIEGILQVVQTRRGGWLLGGDVVTRILIL
jgi:hypothetical protein